VARTAKIPLVDDETDLNPAPAAAVEEAAAEAPETAAPVAEMDARVEDRDPEAAAPVELAEVWTAAETDPDDPDAREVPEAPAPPVGTRPLVGIPSEKKEKRGERLNELGRGRTKEERKPRSSLETEVKVRQLEVAGVEKGAAGVTVFPTV